jgi:uncharacterized protein
VVRETLEGVMTQSISDLSALLQSMRPELHPGVYVFASVSTDTDLGSLEPIATFRENEGLTLIVEEEQAAQAHLPVLFRAAWITLTVHSDLQAVGLTAAVAAALAEAGIACNVVAAAFHDYLFVTVEMGERALAVLQAMASAAASTPREIAALD